MLDYKNVEFIHKFKDFLDTHSYDIITQKICSTNYFINPLPNYEYVKLVLIRQLTFGEQKLSMS